MTDPQDIIDGMITGDITPEGAIREVTKVMIEVSE